MSTVSAGAPPVAIFTGPLRALRGPGAGGAGGDVNLSATRRRCAADRAWVRQAAFGGPSGEQVLHAPIPAYGSPASVGRVSADADSCYEPGVFAVLEERIASRLTLPPMALRVQRGTRQI